MLTHLAFNNSAQSASIFIIDEPELSLHIRWQEIFTKSVLAVNSKIQDIIATHSPSIIINHVDRCFDVSLGQS